MKRVFLGTFLCIILVLSVNTYYGLGNTPIERLHNFTLVSLSLNNLVSTDLENKISFEQKLGLIFVENIYKILVVNDLVKNEVIKNILSKPFNKLWIMMKLLLNFSKKLVLALVCSTRSNFVKIKFFVFSVTFVIPSLVFLTYLKTRFPLPLVLRC